MANRKKFTLDEKRIVYAKYNGKCAICGQPVKFKKMTVDHKVPLSKGGENAMSNLQLACRSCNLMKADLNMEDFVDKLSNIVWVLPEEQNQKYFYERGIVMDYRKEIDSLMDKIQNKALLKRVYRLLEYLYVYVD